MVASSSLIGFPLQVTETMQWLQLSWDRIIPTWDLEGWIEVFPLVTLVLPQGCYLRFDSRGYTSRAKRMPLRAGIRSGSPLQADILSSLRRCLINIWWVNICLITSSGAHVRIIDKVIWYENYFRKYRTFTWVTLVETGYVRLAWRGRYDLSEPEE